MAVKDILHFLAVTERLGTAGQPTEHQICDVAEDGYDVVINLGLLDPRYCLPDEIGLVEALGMEYHHIPVDFGHPRRDDYEAFRAVMATVADKKVFVHCAANIRVSAFVSLYGQQDLGWTEEQAERLATWFGPPNWIWRGFIDRVRAGFAERASDTPEP